MPESLKSSVRSCVRTKNTVHLRGAPQLYAAQLFAEDLRGGAALVLAAMQAEGESTILE